MPSLNAALKTYEVLTALHALPDQAALTTAEAALFLRLSPKTMERLRLDGSGPPYIQGGAASAKGGNQKCLYLKEELLAWQKANQVSNSMEAAIRRGRAFRTISDLVVVDEPFYVDRSRRIDSPAHDTLISVAIERLGTNEWDIVWLSPIEATARGWSNLVMHREYARDVLEIIDLYRLHIAAAIDNTEISLGLL